MKKHTFFLLLLVLFTIALSAQAEQAKTTLVVSSASEEAIQLLRNTHDTVEVQKESLSFSDSADLMTRLLNKDSSVDIYSISVSCGVQALKEKGYLPAIPSDVIAEEISHMLPAIRDVAMQQGQVVAVPYYISTDGWGVNDALWQEICPDRRLETWQDYFELVRWWEQQKELAEEYTLTISGVGRQQLIDEMLRAYIQTYERPDEPLRFDTPYFMDTLAAAVQLTPIEYTGEEDDEAWDDMLNRPTLMQPVMSRLGTFSDRNFRRIPLPAFEEGGRRCVYGDLTLYIINPYSQHQQEATWYLEAVVQTMPEDTAISLSPDGAAPLESPYWQKNYDKNKKELEEIEAAWPEADDATRERLMRRQSTLEKWFSRSDEEQGRYLITAQELEEYQDVMQYLYIGDESLFLGYSDADVFYELLHQTDRYIQGNLTLEGCVQEMNRIAAQLFYENQ